MKLLATMILCIVCTIPQTESKGRRSGRSGRRRGSGSSSSGSSSSGLPARVSELEELFQNQSSWLQALQDQMNEMPTLQDYLTLNQTLFDQAYAIQELEDRIDNIESCTCGRPGTLEIHSPVEYTWEVVGDDCMSVPCGDTFITFQVKSCRDGHVLLMQDNSTTTNIYKLVIGGWNNARSVIRKSQGVPDLAQAYHSPLNCNEFRPFWASWDSGVIRVGTGLTVGVDEFMSYTDPTPTQVNQVAVAILFYSGDWIINASTCSCQN